MADATLLAIDDQEDNLALLDALLTARGFRVLTATGGLAGLALARAERPDLVLLDLQMPGMDGFAVLEALRADRETARMPVIILTANYRDAARVERGLALGATEYLTKPIQNDELEVRIRSALRLAAAEKELARLRQDFASMLVHDMRAPLDGLRLTLGVLRRGEDHASPQWSLLDRAMGALEDLDVMVDDLLQANRLEDEGFQPALAAVAPGPLLGKAAQAMRPLAEARGLRFAVDVPADLPPVLADPALVKRVVENLVGNAVKFTEAGEVRVTARAEEDRLRVTVADTGPGITDAEKARVFDRYFHVERRRKSRQGGFGLGLAFCERAVSAMGGTIAVADVPGGGAAFTFTLKRA